tara:strand:+ start:120 stop:1055 length:936 start_codon:yes stop_codon:yes gene_type:complete
VIYNLEGVKVYDETLEQLLDAGMGVDADILTGRDNPDFLNLNFDGIVMRDRVMDGIYLDHCSFRDADLSGCVFKFGHIRDTDFTGARLKGVQFINCNMRHANLSHVWMSGGRILDSMMRSVNFYSAKLQFVDFTGSDCRKADFREINGRGTIWTGARFTNCDFRSAQFHKTTGLPNWMNKQKEAYDNMPPDYKCISWKLLGENYRGIYRPHMKYEIGKTYDATRGGKSPIDATKNPGIALAPLTWVLKEWMAMGANPNWHLFMVEFNAGDVVSDSNSKFTVSKMKILKEIDLMKYVNQLDDGNIETLQVRE